MRVYYLTSEAEARTILTEGFRRAFVLVFANPPDCCQDLMGDVILSIELPEKIFYQHEEREGEARSATVPAAVVNRCGKPKVHCHNYSGSSRTELLRGAERWEPTASKQGDPSTAEGMKKKAAEMRNAVKFFDDVGWLNVTENFTQQ